MKIIINHLVHIFLSFHTSTWYPNWYIFLIIQNSLVSKIIFFSDTTVLYDCFMFHCHKKGFHVSACQQQKTSFGKMRNSSDIKTDFSTHEIHYKFPTLLYIYTNYEQLSYFDWKLIKQQKTKIVFYDSSITSETPSEQTVRTNYR